MCIRDSLKASQRMQSSLQVGLVTGAWSVWSRTDATLHNVVSVECDDAFDTQRRRGVDPLVRNSLATL